MDTFWRKEKSGTAGITIEEKSASSVVDPGFPVGRGADPLGGAPTSDVYTFWQKRMQKRKKLILLGGGCMPAMPPLDPPMLMEVL